MKNPEDELKSILQRKVHEEQIQKEALLRQHEQRLLVEAREKQKILESSQELERVGTEAVLPLLKIVQETYIQGESEITTESYRDPNWGGWFNHIITLGWSHSHVTSQDGNMGYQKNITIVISRADNPDSSTAPAEYVLQCREYLSTYRHVRTGLFRNGKEKRVWNTYITMNTPNWKEQVISAILKCIDRQA